MSGFLFNEVIFGPVNSRRLGVSLGINLLPTNYKYCTYNCIYCECGWNKKHESGHLPLPKREEISKLLKEKLEGLKQEGITPENITFAGNGEPTIHPDFAEIIDDTIAIRNQYLPEAAITVLSNASLSHKSHIHDALLKVDNNILKLDAGSNTQFHRINLANSNTNIDKLVDHLCSYNGDLIVQTLFLKGTHEGEIIDNTTEEEINLWLKHLSRIKPKMVMIYPIDRETPAQDLHKIPKEKLTEIAARVNELGIETEVY